MSKDMTTLIDKFNNEKITGLTDCEQMNISNALKDLEMYQNIGTIAEFLKSKEQNN